VGELIVIEDKRRERDLTVQEAWDAYVAADEKAKTSHDIRDGIAAGKAWARWLALFEGKRA
jgi:hypothetical protein